MEKIKTTPTLLIRKCKLHDNDLLYYCTDTECKDSDKFACEKCLSQGVHKNHENSHLVKG